MPPNNIATKPKSVPRKKAAPKKDGSFAVIATGGKQYVVSGGDTLSIEKLPKSAHGKTAVFDKVLLLDDGKKTTVGTPYISGVKIKCEVVSEGKGKKITVLKYKSKIRYRVKRGHRQHFTKVKISPF